MSRFLADYRNVFGILGLLVAICLYISFSRPDAFLTSANLQNLIRWSALFGIIGIGVSFVIMTGGIDLSIGSMIALTAVLLAMWLQPDYEALDVVKVTGADAEARRLEVTGRPPFEPGDTVVFLGAPYTIQEASDGALRVVEPLGTGRQGNLLRAWNVAELSEERPTPVRRGERMMRVREVVLEGPAAGIQRGDRLELIPEVGNAKTYVIHRVDSGPERLRVEFLVRPNERVSGSLVAATLSRRSQPVPTTVAVLLTLLVATLLGMVHGLLITRLRLQPFIVTLCGLLIYRGVARFITGDQQQGFSTEYPNLKLWANGNLMETLTGVERAYDIPIPFICLIVIALVAAAFLNQTIYGRYILAVGRNEEAARYSGINTERMTVLAYMICGLCSGIAGVLFALHINSIQPAQFGNFYELYAIAAAVLGGCSLRGGEGTVVGVVIAAGVMQVLRNTINLDPAIPLSLEFGIIGMVILGGVIIDELVKRVAAHRRRGS